MQYALPVCHGKDSDQTTSGEPADTSSCPRVGPLLRSASDPPFRYVKEIIDFVNHILEVGRRPCGLWGPDLGLQGLMFLNEMGGRRRGSPAWCEFVSWQ